MMIDLIAEAGPAQIYLNHSHAKKKPTRNENEEAQYVWPWVEILANIPIELSDGCKVMEAMSNFNPSHVHCLSQSNARYAMLKFENDWTGFKDAMMFECHFEATLLGRKDWIEREEHGEPKLYGWLAHAEDYDSIDLLWEHPRQNGSLKTISEIENEDAKDTGMILENLNNQINAKNEDLHIWESKCSETTFSINKLIGEQDKLHENYNKEMLNLEWTARDHARSVFRENGQLRAELDKKIKEVELQNCRI
ncbi:hypothetical protein ZOSMA_3G00110 [Zostera marina]|uniref:XS domain-containing protein n=1 Tax=Zostera marina TaxID=29655 RepID=A0A0K9P3B5_ZOSMR|nr:hypothetical protein ZOSMA_3G00110 [Zostera marina]